MPRLRGASSYSLGGWYSRCYSRPCRALRRRRQQCSWLQLAGTYSLLCLVLLNTMVARCGAVNGSDPMVAVKTTNVSATDDRTCSLEETRLNEVTVSRICNCLSRLKSREQALGFIRMFNLEFCDMIRVQEAVSFLMNATLCTMKLTGILLAEQDALVAYNNFLGIIGRVDCSLTYSVRWKCRDCEHAYKNWICYSEVLPRLSPKRPTPCRSLCHKVLQRCPYFLPGSEYQWSGQSAFECPDDELEEQECISMTESTTAHSTLQTLKPPTQQSKHSENIGDENLDLGKKSTS